MNRFQDIKLRSSDIAVLGWMGLSWRLGLALMLCLFVAGSHAQADDSAGVKMIASLVIQDQGRIKPVDTFAQNQLLAVYQAQKIRSEKLKASDWLYQLMFHAELAYDKKHYKIRKPEVIEALGMEVKLDHLYDFRSLRRGMNSITTDLQKWFQMEEEQRSMVQNQVLRLYQVLGQYYQVSRSFSLFVEDLSTPHPDLAKTFGLEPDQKVSYLYFHRQSDLLRKEVTRLTDVGKGERNERDEALIRLVTALSERIQDQVSTQLAIIPSPPTTKIETWSSPWALMSNHDIDPWTNQRLDELQAFCRAQSLGDWASAEKHLDAFKAAVAHRKHIDKELMYNRVDLFMYSMVFYLISFIALLLGWMVLPKALWWVSLISSVVGLALHTYGLIMRMVIMGRPPVSTLYESIIFVGFIAVLMCVILEWVRRNGIGLFSGTVLGVVLHFIGFSYADDGDTMGMLVAVLDSNFWLATHVVTITMGYGITVVAGLIGHLYLIKAIIDPKNDHALKEIYKNSVGISLVALLFTTLGTILGGIWADQSWGRFWGWDPKENGAMLIVLWLLMLLHGRISGQVKALGFAAGLVIANIVVALAWFGVNLLNVGLHNYGFTESIAYNLSVFCGIEIAFALVGYLWAYKRQVAMS